MNNKNAKLLESAKGTAARVATWADLSNALFDPDDGLITKAYPTRDQREAFLETEEYAAIRKLLEGAIEKTGIVNGATPQKSGKVLVRMPKSLHAALQREAKSEGVSLNQLVVTKLAVQLSELASGSPVENC